MGKDKRIADFPGISQANVVALSRIGLLTATDLLNADYERLAVVLDDFDEAARLVREARKAGDVRKAKEATPPPPVPLASHPASAPAQRSTIRIGTSGSGSRTKNQSAAGAGVVGQALTLAATGIQDGPDWRASLSRQLHAVRLLLDNEGTPQEISAALLLDAIESSTGSDAGRLGAELEALLEECIALRAVPALPSGKLPRYYLEMAAKATLSARRVCAAALLASGLNRPDRAELLAEALLAGESDPIVNSLGGPMETVRDAA